MVLARGSRAPSRKGLVQQMNCRDQLHLKPSPVRKPATAETCNLPGQELRGTILNSVIVWFNDPVFVLIVHSYQTFAFDCRSEQSIYIQPEIRLAHSSSMISAQSAGRVLRRVLRNVPCKNRQIRQREPAASYFSGNSGVIAASLHPRESLQGRSQQNAQSANLVPARSD